MAFLTQQKLLPAAEKLSTHLLAKPNEPALRSNQQLLTLLSPHHLASTIAPAPPTARVLDAASFAELYHGALQATQRIGQGATRQLRPWLTQVQQATAQPENASYYEQLLFLQALLLHAGSQEVLARQALAPLTVGTSSTAAYYQYLLGIWQLQQQQYATAATQFGLAAEHGLPLAQPARAWALRFAGQADSAQALARRLATSPDSAARPVGQRLLAALAATPTFHPKLPRVGDALLAKAWQAEPNPTQAAKLYQQLLAAAPFNEPAVLAAAHFYTTQRRPDDAYEALRLGLVENPTSLPLQQAFVLAAADAGLAELAQPALDELRPRLDPATYANLLTQFAARRAAYAAARASFSADAAPPLPSR